MVEHTKDFLIKIKSLSYTQNKHQNISLSVLFVLLQVQNQNEERKENQVKRSETTVNSELQLVIDNLSPAPPLFTKRLRGGASNDLSKRNLENAVRLASIQPG